MPNFNNSKSSTDGQGTFAWNFGKPESPKDEQDSFAWNFGKPESSKDEHDTLVRNFGRELDIAEDRLAKKRCFVSESMNETARQWAQENNLFSIYEDREYVSYIFETSNGLFRTFRNPVIGNVDGFLLSDLEARRKEEGLEGLKIVGIIHSHGAENPQYNSEEFSTRLRDENGNVSGDLFLSEEVGLPLFWHKIIPAGQHRNSRGLFGNYHERKKGNYHVLPEEWCKFIKKYGYLSSADTFYVEVND